LIWKVRINAQLGFGQYRPHRRRAFLTYPNEVLNPFGLTFHHACVPSSISSEGKVLPYPPRLAGWFYGSSCNGVINDQGELLAFCLAPDNVDDRHPVPKLAKCLLGKLVGDTGYLSQPLAQHLLMTQGLQLINKLHKKMHNHMLD